MAKIPVARHVESAVEAALADTRVVAVVGPRQAGKSTLVGGLARKRQATYLTLDDNATLAAATTDPVAFIQRREGLLAIDEVQRAPSLLLAIKAAVDLDPRPGRFLLTGSAHLFAVKDVADSLAGRMEIVELWPFSQGEMNGRRERFIDHAFQGSLPLDYRSHSTRLDYFGRVTRGGFPEAIGRAQARRKAWFRSYVRAVVAREVPGVSDIERLAELPRLVRLCAARHSSTLNVAALARDAGLPERTTHRYLDALEAVFLIRRIPAWTANLTSREARAPKLFLTDSGLAASLRGASTESLARPEQAQGAEWSLLEGFVVGEVERQTTWSEVQPRVHHFRDRNDSEVDVVLEADDGGVVGIEVKSGAAVDASHTAGLRLLRDRLGRRFRFGVVFYTGPLALPFGDRIVALPLDTLWTR